MATRKTLQSVTLNGDQVTPAGDVSLPVGNSNWEPMRNLDGSIDYKYIPSDETATLPVSLDANTVTVIRTALNITGWSCTMNFRDGTAAQISNAAIVNNPSLDGDGMVEIELFGDVRWL